MANDNVTPINGPTTAASIKAAAQAEVQADLAKGAKAKMVSKLRQIADTKKVLANLEQELAVLEKDIEAELAQ